MKDYIGNPIKIGSYIVKPGNRGNGEEGLITYRVIAIRKNSISAQRIFYSKKPVVSNNKILVEQNMSGREVSFVYGKTTVITKNNSCVVVRPSLLVTELFEYIFDAQPSNTLFSKTNNCFKKWLKGQNKFNV